MACNCGKPSCKGMVTLNSCIECCDDDDERSVRPLGTALIKPFKVKGVLPESHFNRIVKKVINEKTVLNEEKKPCDGSYRDRGWKTECEECCQDVADYEDTFGKGSWRYGKECGNGKKAGGCYTYNVRKNDDDKYYGDRAIHSMRLNEEPGCRGWFDCPGCGYNSGKRVTCKKDGKEINTSDGGGTCGCEDKNPDRSVIDLSMDRVTQDDFMFERKDYESEYSADRPHVCVKGDCYKRKDAPDVPCNTGENAGWGYGGKCFKSGRACRRKCHK